MSYVVLARKWRPMTFSDLVGQEHVAKTLGNAIKLDRVAHAFLFTGVRGVGKTTSARILAKALNCEKGPSVTPCLACPQCLEIALGSDMDVQEIDAASRTGVDDIRELQETLAYRPSRDRFKIFIVDEVHMLSTSAWNAFLKTLEEPPAHVKFIFATTEVTKVPVTILSRCQRYDFKMIDAATVRARLAYVLKEEGITAEDGALQILAREAAGSMRDGMSLLDQVIAWSGGEAITTAAVARALGVAETTALIGLARSLVTGDAAKCLETVQNLTDSGHDVAHLSRDILSVLRDLVVARVAPGSRGLLAIPDVDLAELEAIANAAPSADDLSRLHLVFAKATEEILESPLPRASLEMALVRGARRPPLLAIDDLLRRLGELEGRLESARTGTKREAGTKPRAKPATPAADPEPAPRPSPPPPSPSPPAFSVPVAAPVVHAAHPSPQVSTQRLVEVPAAHVFEIPKHILERAVAAQAAAEEFAPEPEAGILFDEEDDDGDVASIPPPAARGPMSDRPPRSHRPNVPAPTSARALAALTPRGGREPIRDAKANALYDYAGFVDHVRATSSRVSSLLERVAILEFTPERLSLLVDPVSFEGTFLVEEDSVRVAEDALRERFGPRATLELVAAEEEEEDGLTLARLATEATFARSAEQGERVRNHPLVATLVRTLSAEIKDVRLANDEHSETLVQMLDRLRAS